MISTKAMPSAIDVKFFKSNLANIGQYVFIVICCGGSLSATKEWEKEENIQEYCLKHSVSEEKEGSGDSNRRRLTDMESGIFDHLELVASSTNESEVCRSSRNSESELETTLQTISNSRKICINSCLRALTSSFSLTSHIPPNSGFFTANQISYSIIQDDEVMPCDPAGRD
ncbi:hypothetical protein Tco_0764296 [Tanacetum coccineum]